MKLRRLELKDAQLMLEWMHDPDVVANMQTDFMSKTIDDCIRFIEYAQNTKDSLHLAVVDDDDIYMGTVSLKHIEFFHKTAEFAITVRKAAMGKGYSSYGMKEIIRKGIEDLELSSVYWCVSPDNERAVCFYDKNGYSRLDYHKLGSIISENYTDVQIESFIWYQVTKNFDRK